MPDPQQFWSVDQRTLSQVAFSFRLRLNRLLSFTGLLSYNICRIHDDSGHQVVYSVNHIWLHTLKVLWSSRVAVHGTGIVVNFQPVSGLTAEHDASRICNQGLVAGSPELRVRRIVDDHWLQLAACDKRGPWAIRWPLRIKHCYSLCISLPLINFRLDFQSIAT